MTDDQVRELLAARFAGTVGERPGLHVPAALRESIVGAARLDGGRGLDALTAYYGERMPRLLLEQLDDATPAGALLGRPLDLARLPRLRAALDGLHAALAGAGLDGSALLGATDVARLVAERPTVAALFEGSLFGSGLPMVGAYPAERALLTAELAAGADPDALLDRRLSGNLVHELCHGPRRERSSPPPPWIVTEAAALELGHVAFARHLLPDEPGEAVPGVSLFVLLGQSLARRLGRRALWGLLVDDDHLEGRVGAALATAGWQQWRRRPEPPFARDALDAVAWIKLADAALGPTAIDSLLDDAAARDPRDAAATLPDLLAAADALPWPTLPWWSAAPTSDDDAMLATAVRALFQVQRITPSFQTHPAELADGRIVVDVESCLISAARRPDGVFAEPARWLLPPPHARRLATRGARRVLVEGARRCDAAPIAAALVELVHGTAPLDAETRLVWRAVE